MMSGNSYAQKFVGTQQKFSFIISPSLALLFLFFSFCKAFCYNIYMNGLEPIIQIISILVFISGGITFFFKTGGYKTNIDTKLTELENDNQETKNAIKEIRQEISTIKAENAKVINTLTITLAEIKSKLELLIDYSGIINGRSRNKK